MEKFDGMESERTDVDTWEFEGMADPFAVALAVLSLRCIDAHVVEGQVVLISERFTVAEIISEVV